MAQKDNMPKFAEAGGTLPKKAMMGQKIFFALMLVAAVIVFFVVTAEDTSTTENNNNNTQAQPSQSQEQYDDVRFANVQKLKQQLLEDARRKNAVPPTPQNATMMPSALTPGEDPEAMYRMAMQNQEQPKVIVIQRPAPVKRQQKPVRVTDAQRAAGQEYHDLRVQSLKSESLVGGFEGLGGGRGASANANENANANAAQGNGNNISGSNSDQSTIATLAALSDGAAGADLTSIMPHNTSNGYNNFNNRDHQGDKIDFVNTAGLRTPQGYSQNMRQPQVMDLELKAGTIIPGLLITGINSDLPGTIIGQVSENVYDTATGRWILIPQGTRILGVYDSRTSAGQKRAGVVWNRLLYPDGSTLNIAGSPGTDQAGYSGISGKVNNHYGELVSAALLTTLFTAGIEIVHENTNNDSNNNNNNNRRRPSDIIAETVATNIANIGTQMAQRALSIQPTIVIKPGTRFNVMVQEDIIFPSPWIEPRTQVNGL